MKHLNIKIFGVVQGVFFRDSTKEEAEKLNITGFVRNESDGSVYIEAEGEEEKLRDFLEWCKNGPRFAKVDKIESQEGVFKNFIDFSAY